MVSLYYINQEKFESVLLEKGTLLKNQIRIKGKQWLFVEKVNSRDYIVSLTFNTKLSNPELLYQFDSYGNLIKASIIINWLGSILINVFLPVVFFAIMDYSVGDSFSKLFQSWHIYFILGLILFGLQVLFYYGTQKIVKKEIELQLLEDEFNIKDSE